MPFIRSILGLLVLSLTLSACASTGNSSSRPSDSGSWADRIVVDELDISTAGVSAYELVNRYKSHWLRKRGVMSIRGSVPVKVFVDEMGSAFGGVNSLRRIRADAVAYIEHYRGPDAQAKFGMSTGNGVIYVRTKPVDG